MTIQKVVIETFYNSVPSAITGMGLPFEPSLMILNAVATKRKS